MREDQLKKFEQILRCIRTSIKESNVARDETFVLPRRGCVVFPKPTILVRVPDCGRNTNRPYES